MPVSPHFSRPSLLLLALWAAGARRAGAQEPASGVDAAAEPAPSAPAPELDPEAPLPEVVVRTSSQPQRLRESARAVKVVETQEAQRHSADLGELLARTEGVGVQRSGGLGSETRISLHGLTDDQIRFFLDGVPLEFSGFGLGVSSVPLNWIERVDVYRGIVPVHFGADALGGAIDLVTDQHVRGSAVAASYLAGAFDTHQLAASARTLSPQSGLLARGAGFFDNARNDYTVGVQVPDTLGRLHPAEVRRFHDGYRAGGGSAEVGFIDRPWARALQLRVFGTAFDKDLQNNFNMSVPYGEVTYGQTVFGGTLRYESAPSESGLRGAVLLGYSHRRLDFSDQSPWVYDWFGNRVFDRGPGAGELSAYASDLTQWEHRSIGRASLGYELAAGHSLLLVTAPDFTTRTGSERLRVNPERIDPLTTRRNFLQLVTGLEYAFRDPSERVENRAFVKHYYYHPDTNQVEVFDNSVHHRTRTLQRFGAGDALRIQIVDGLIAKLAYEYATRLPRPDEVFGDGALINPNLELVPETGHNANLGALLELPLGPRAGTLSSEVTAFLRQTADMIVELPAGDRVHTVNENVVDVRTAGMDGMLRWASPGELLSIGANLTWIDQRNSSTQGPFAPFEGQRLPNRPWLFSNAGVELRIPHAAAAHAELSLSWQTRYVHEFYPGWLDTAAQNDAGKIPSQLTHTASLAYLLRGPLALSFALDVVNLTDERVFDVLGVQRPGRAAYFKITVDWAAPSSAELAPANG